MQVTIRDMQAEKTMVYRFDEMIARSGLYECVVTGKVFFVTIDRNCFQVLSNNIRFIPYDLSHSPEFDELRLMEISDTEIVLKF